MWNSKYNYTENIETKYCHRLIKRSACKPIVIIVKNNISMSFEFFFFQTPCRTLSRNFEIFVCTPRRTGAIHGDPKIKEKYSERERVWERRSRRNGDRETEREKTPVTIPPSRHIFHVVGRVSSACDLRYCTYSADCA